MHARRLEGGFPRYLCGAIDDRILALSLAEIAEIPTLVALAAGTEKEAGLRGALADSVIVSA